MFQILNHQPVQFRQTLPCHCLFLVAVQVLEVSAKQTNQQKNQLIYLTFIFCLPHHLLNNLNIYYYTATNIKITKASLSMICSILLSERDVLAEVIKWWSLELQFKPLNIQASGFQDTSLLSVIMILYFTSQISNKMQVDNMKWSCLITNPMFALTSWLKDKKNWRDYIS